MKHFSIHHALTLMETLTMIVILGVVLFLTLPRLATSKYSSERAAVKAKAIQLNLAKDAFISANGITAAQNKWDGKSNETRWKDIIRTFLPADVAKPDKLNPTSTNDTVITAFGRPGYLLEFNDIVTFPVSIYHDADVNGSKDGTDTIGYR